ncbi:MULTISPECIES: tyrosine recombinase XerC [Thiomicrorhabdus]|uniref:Tyrosine recombinase XerC n=1 Tax=Thiomicrorhabdus heinhorstiae TaxID=2748010 RepID=A0ABS0BVV6_9GAMM|nr:MULTISPECIES: tyrosine recombinase XerC [Thiomicrorhabdus]MBF6057957.1 tyrosine recombinase XerC [Thiomicrorhabdus heinhorstiae]
MQLREAFLRELKLQNRSQHTIDNYQRDLLAFAEFYLQRFEEELDAEAFDGWVKVDAAVIRDFVAERMAQGISARTLSRQLSALRSLFDFLLEIGRISLNPARGIRAPKQPKPLPKSLDVDWTQQLLEQPLHDWMDIRDQAIFELLYSAGLRVAECAGLNLNPGLDELADGWVRVVGKGQKMRLAPVGSKALTALQNWLEIRKEYAGENEPAVFVGRGGKRLGIRSIQQRLDRRALIAGLPTKMSPHRFRHACATHVLESSGDLRGVQEMLGHANLSTTQIYTKLDMQHLAKVYDQAHPRAKKR